MTRQWLFAGAIVRWLLIGDPCGLFGEVVTKRWLVIEKRTLFVRFSGNTKGYCATQGHADHRRPLGRSVLGSRKCSALVGRDDSYHLNIQY